jgi:hypothetical protein
MPLPPWVRSRAIRGSERPFPTVRVVGARVAASQWWLYPYSTLLAGFGFFMMGSAYWGGCYVIGLAFWVLATLMPGRFEIAPLAYAGLWCAALGTIGCRLRVLGRAESPAPPTASPDEMTRSQSSP